MLNKVTLIGRLGADPESKTMNSGAEIVNFHMVTSESYTDKKTHQKVDKTEWHSIVVFNPHLAKIALQYLRKGSKVYVEGQLQTRKWQDQSGHDRYSTEIVLKAFHGEIILLEKSGQSNLGVENNQQVGGTYSAMVHTSSHGSFENEIPF
ncbi:single-stranded DNA-binding protein [Bartonella queenslandensis]|uniref:single-stranded DNA-binding protein n=1 Tax=Bartonella queenslandensis TaxID=481138 RepID=UPI0002F3D412|nr:single-stranded DNA-binding protein [Bartonella queenslandensis]